MTKNALARTSLALFAVGLCGCSSPTKPSGATAATPTLRLTIDGRSTATAIVGASEVAVDAQQNPGDATLSYDIDFGDGSPHDTKATASHVYSAAGSFTITLRVTGRQKQTTTATQRVTVQTVEGAWSHSALNPQVNKVETRWLTIAAQNGAEVKGVYFSSSAAADRAFTGTVQPGRRLHLLLEDGTITFDGQVPDEVRAANVPMPVAVHGGTADGETLPFLPAIDGRPPAFDGVTIHGLESFVPFALRDQIGRGIPLTATLVSGGLGKADDCTDRGVWESSNPAVINFGTGPRHATLQNFPLSEGSTTIRVNCDGMIGSARFEISHWTLRLKAIDVQTGQPLPGVDLHASGSGSSVSFISNPPRSANDGQLTQTWTAPDLRVWLFRPGYQPVWPVPTVSWNNSPMVDVTVPMTREAGTLLAEGDVPSPSGQSYAFNVPNPGTLRLRYYWPSYSDYAIATIHLSCNGTSRDFRFYGSFDTFDVPVLSGPCTLTFTDLYLFRLRFGVVLLN